MAERHWAIARLCPIAAGLIAALVLVVVAIAPAEATPRLSPGLNSTDAILKWINSYRHKPDPEGLPVVVHCIERDASLQRRRKLRAVYRLHRRRARRQSCCLPKTWSSRMLSIDPADHWVLVRAIAYSGLSDWKDLLATFVDRMPTRREMIDKYLDGKLPTLEQIDFQAVKPGMLDKIKATLNLDQDRKQVVALEPTPELIDVLWGYYLATGSYAPIKSVIKLLPLSNDKDNVDNLTTGSAAKFTLASNAVRDTDLLAMLQWAVKSQPDDIVPVLKDVIETAETVDTVHMRQESLAAIDELKEKGPNSKRELSGWGQVGQGALSMGCVVAAATGQIELGIPCVIGGAAYTAGLQYVTH